MDSHAFVYIRHEQQASLCAAIQAINAARSVPPPYESLIVSEPRQGWMALLLGIGCTDHLLLRNLSGRLHTLAFEMALGQMLTFEYRFHRQGKTIDAFESNLRFYVSKRLNDLSDGDSIQMLDLAEPVERLVLRTFQHRQRAIIPQDALLEITPELQAHYGASPGRLRALLRSEADIEYIANLLLPGFNPEAVFQRMTTLLTLPYLPSDYVQILHKDGQAERITGYAITQPATWADALPPGWRRIAALPRT